MQTIGLYAFGNIKKLSFVFCYPETIPSIDHWAFDHSPINEATLYVPATLVDSYKANSPWSSFEDVLTLEDANKERCAKPTISMKDGEIVFACETSDVTYVTEYTPLNNSTTEGNKMALPNRFRISVYAKKDGLVNSSVASTEVEMTLGSKGDVDGNGVVNAADHVKLSEIILNKNE